MFAVKPEREQVFASSCMDKISGFEAESRVLELGEDYYASIGLKQFNQKDRYFSIDFTDASVRKGDHCKVTKTTEMRADEFWDGLTAFSKTTISKVITEAKLKGKTALQDELDHLQLMFKKPDVVFGSETANMSSLLGRFSLNIAGYYSNLAVNHSGDVFFSDFSNLYKLSYSTQDKSGQIVACDRLQEKVASLSCFERHDNLIALGGVCTKNIKLIDTNITKELFRYELKSSSSTACLMAKQDSLLAVVDDHNFIHLYDIRSPTAIRTLNNFASSPQGTIGTLQLENNQLLIGTSDGPIMLPLSEAIVDTVTLPTAESHRSAFVTQDVVVTARFGSPEIKLLNINTGQKMSFNIPNEQITDITVSGDRQSIAVVSVNAEESKSYLRLIEKRGSEYDWTQYLKLGRTVYKVLFSKKDELMVADEHYFQVFHTANPRFVSVLKDKLSRYLK